MTNNGRNGSHANSKTETKPSGETIAPTQDFNPASFELRILDPRKIRIFRAAGIPRLTLQDDRSWSKVSVARAFPLSDPKHYIGFLDGAGKDVGLLHDPDQLDPESRKLVEEELEKRYFVPIVERVSSVKEEFGTIYWTVETDRGAKKSSFAICATTFRNWRRAASSSRTRTATASSSPTSTNWTTKVWASSCAICDLIQAGQIRRQRCRLIWKAKSRW